jgi:hypothetical protein
MGSLSPTFPSAPRSGGDRRSADRHGRALVAASHREGTETVRRYFEHRSEGRPPPVSEEGKRTDVSRFNEVERRLREFATVPCLRLLP